MAVRILLVVGKRGFWDNLNKLSNSLNKLKLPQQTQQKLFCFPPNSPQTQTNSNNSSSAKINSKIFDALGLAVGKSLSLWGNRGDFGEIFVEFVGSVFFVDLRLSQNPLLPTTDAKFSVREILKFATSKLFSK